MLEALPIELFREVTSYLRFLDKKALSIASRRCNAKTEISKCPDQLTWLIHLCRSPAKFQGPLLANPKLFRDLIFSLHSYLIYKSGRLISLKAEIEELVLPYFVQPFPESTLLYHYMNLARDFVKSAIRDMDDECLSTAPLSPRYYWGRIENETVYVIGWLERQKPTRTRCCHAVPRVDYSILMSACALTDMH